MSIDVMKQALEALEEINKLSVGENAICLPAEIDGAMDALRAAIDQAQEWQGLTDEEIMEPWPFENRIAFARWIEAKLKEKNA